MVTSLRQCRSGLQFRRCMLQFDCDVTTSPFDINKKTSHDINVPECNIHSFFLKQHIILISPPLPYSGCRKTHTSHLMYPPHNLYGSRNKHTLIKSNRQQPVKQKTLFSCRLMAESCLNPPVLKQHILRHSQQTDPTRQHLHANNTSKIKKTHLIFTSTT